MKRFNKEHCNVGDVFRDKRGDILYVIVEKLDKIFAFKSFWGQSDKIVWKAYGDFDVSTNYEFVDNLAGAGCARTPASQSSAGDTITDGDEYYNVVSVSDSFIIYEWFGQEHAVGKDYVDACGWYVVVG